MTTELERPGKRARSLGLQLSARVGWSCDQEEVTPSCLLARWLTPAAIIPHRGVGEDQTETWMRTILSAVICWIPTVFQGSKRTSEQDHRSPPPEKPNTKGLLQSEQVPYKRLFCLRRGPCGSRVISLSSKYNLTVQWRCTSLPASF